MASLVPSSCIQWNPVSCAGLSNAPSPTSDGAATITIGVSISNSASSPGQVPDPWRMAMSMPPVRISRTSGVGSIIRDTSGWAARNRARRGISQFAAKDGVAETCTGRSASAPVRSATARAIRSNPV